MISKPMSSFDTLTTWFRKFPGIGPRQAKRFVYFLLSQTESDLRGFGEALTTLRQEIQSCTECFRFFYKGASKSLLCPTCHDPNRRTDVLMIVPKDVDFEAIEKSGVFDGKYFILGGTAHLLEKENTHSELRLRELQRKVENMKKEKLSEIIIATNLNPEGDYTSQIVIETLSPILKGTPVKISFLGRGLSTGIELEYVDPETIKNALKNRV